MTTVKGLKESTGKDFIEDFDVYYSNESFQEKIKKFRDLLKECSGELIFLIMKFRALLQQTLSASETALVLGALGYFILPIDMISDYFPVIGFADDLLIFKTAAKLLFGYKNPAETTLKELEEVELKNAD